MSTAATPPTGEPPIPPSPLAADPLPPLVEAELLREAREGVAVMRYSRRPGCLVLRIHYTPDRPLTVGRSEIELGERRQAPRHRKPTDR